MKFEDDRSTFGRDIDQNVSKKCNFIIENRDHTPRFSPKLSDQCSYEAEEIRYNSLMVCKHSVKITALYLHLFLSYRGHRRTDGQTNGFKIFFLIFIEKFIFEKFFLEKKIFFPKSEDTKTCFWRC